MTEMDDLNKTPDSFTGHSRQGIDEAYNTISVMSNYI